MIKDEEINLDAEWNQAIFFDWLAKSNIGVSFVQQLVVENEESKEWLISYYGENRFLVLSYYTELSKEEKHIPPEDPLYSAFVQACTVCDKETNTILSQEEYAKYHNIDNYGFETETTYKWSMMLYRNLYRFIGEEEFNRLYNEVFGSE